MLNVQTEHENNKYTKYTVFYMENPRREKPQAIEISLYQNVQVRPKYNTLCSKCINHARLLASSLFQVWRRSLTSKSHSAP